MRTLWIVPLVLAFALVSSASEEGPPTVDTLLAQLRSAQDEELKTALLMKLARRGDEAAPAMDDALTLLDDGSAEVQAAAAIVLGAIGAPNEHVITKLAGKMHETRRRDDLRPVWMFAGKALGRLGSKALPDLLNALSSEKAHLRRSAAIGIHEVGAAGAPAVSRLVELLDEDPDIDVQRDVMYALMGIGPAAESAVPSIARKLSSEDFHLQYWACRSLAAVGGEAVLPTVPRLVELVSTGNASVRSNAALALGQIGPAAGESILQPLADALDDRAYIVRESAAKALARLGPFAQSTAPAIEAALQRKTFRARIKAAVALCRVTGKPDPGMSLLVEELCSDDNPITAALAFGQLQEFGAPAVEKLTPLLRDENARTRLFTITALARLEGAALSAVPALEAMQEDPDPDVIKAARQAVGVIRSASETN